MPLEWRKNEFGEPDQALYIGAICVGHISRFPPEGWRDWSDKVIGDSREVYEWHEGAGPWRAWIQSDESGSELGWYMTADEARKAVSDWAEAQITG